MSSLSSSGRAIRVSYVILNYGYAEFTPDCLRSLEESANRDEIEIILVDNGSPETALNQLKAALCARSLQPDIFIELQCNEGFAAGMNRGISAARGDVIVAVNSDTIVGNNVTRMIADAAGCNPDAGFFAVPIYNAPLHEGRLMPGTDLQAHVVGLTWYASCMPIAADRLAKSYILGPPGCFVAMSRALVETLQKRYLCVYDPHFFLYGEDTDLFLRALECGFRTLVLHGTPGAGTVVWHAGSATTANGSIPTVSKSPEFGAMILRGFWENAVHYAGYLELPAVILIQGVFRAAFMLSYFRANSTRTLLRLLGARQPSVPARRAARRHIRPWLLPRVGLSHKEPLPWARPRAASK